MELTRVRIKSKKPRTAKIDWGQILVQAVIDFFIGFLLLVVGKPID